MLKLTKNTLRERFIKVVGNRKKAPIPACDSWTADFRDGCQSGYRLACLCNDHFFTCGHATQETRKVGLGLVNVDDLHEARIDQFRT